MNHEMYKQRVSLYVYDELDPDEREKIDLHIKECQECRKALREYRMLQEHAPKAEHPSESDMMILRHALVSSLLDEREKRSLPEKIAHWLRRLADALALNKPITIPRYTIATVAVTALSAGLFGGVLLPVMLTLANGGGAITAVRDQDQQTGALRIASVRLIKQGSAKNQVEIHFDSFQEKTFVGDMQDENIRRLLAYSLTTESNPGVRLNALEVLAAYQQPIADSAIEIALISALTSDLNPAVRMEALNTLKVYPSSKRTKLALLHALAHDDNAGIRIAAINTLQPEELQDQKDSVIALLQQSVRNDNNSYVKYRTQALLEELSNVKQ